MSVIFVLITALFFITSYGKASTNRPNENNGKIRIVLEERCCSNYGDIRQEIFSSYRCLSRSKTSNRDLIFRKNCIIYAKINSNAHRCYDNLQDHECVKRVQFEQMYYIDDVDYRDDVCAIQDVSQDDPCLLVYDTAYGAFGTECASSYLNEPVKPFYHLTYWYPNDDFFPNSYIYLDATQIPAAEEIDVWILDQGIDVSHIEFIGVDIEKIGYGIDDPETFGDHGTAVASNAIGNNIGIARGFSIKDCPVCQLFGGSCASEDIENCLMEIRNYYSNTNATGRRFVINMSFGGGSNLYDDHFDEIIEIGGILVAAAGNGRSNNDLLPHYPGSHPLAIAVGGYNQDRNMYNAIGGSNYGTNSVQYYAAAQNVLVAWDSASASNGSNEFYTYVEGTSFASPIVAGEIANILARDLTLTLEEIRDELDSRVVGDTLNCPVESCPMIEGYCNILGGTTSPTMLTTNPTLEPTNSPLVNSCTSNICLNVGTPIEDYQTYLSTINITQNDIPQFFPEFKSMKVTVQGTHTWQADLIMKLISPSNREILLVSTIGGSDNDFYITFSDEANSYPTNLNVNGNEYLPVESFSNFEFENPIGSWTFSLMDQFGADNGIWDAWCITELCFYHESDDIFELDSTTQEPEPQAICCRTRPLYRSINYECRDFNRRQCINDPYCRYQRNLIGC